MDNLIIPFELYKVCTYPEVRQDYYMISDHGNVISIKTGLIKSNNYDRDGYHQTMMVRPLDHELGPKPIRIHQLVSHEFIGTKPDGFIPNHIDGVKDNNYFSNLEYITPSKNNIHAYDNGLAKKGEDHYLNKYDENLIHHICIMIQDKYSNKQIRESLGINTKHPLQNTIKDLRRRKVWRHVTKLYNY